MCPPDAREVDARTDAWIVPAWTEPTCGAEFLVLPPYSSNLDPIEMAFSKLKALLREDPERTVDGRWAAIARIFETFAPQECRN